MGAREFWLVVAICWGLGLIVALQAHSTFGAIIAGGLTAHCLVQRARCRRKRP
jgi:hypothetical protein